MQRVAGCFAEEENPEDTKTPPALEALKVQTITKESLTDVRTTASSLIDDFLLFHRQPKS